MEIRKDLTVGKLLREAVEKYPDRPAVNTRDKGILTYREFDKRVDILAGRLISCGVRKGTHVGVLFETSPRLVFLYFALARIGAISVLYNTSIGTPELMDLINRSDTSVMLIGDGYKEISFPREVRAIMPQCPGLKKVLFVGKHDPLGFEILDEVEPADLDLVYREETKVGPQDTVNMLFTSGTTSSPKMVLTSHFSRVNCGRLQAEDLRATCEDVFLAALPMFHCFSITVNIIAACSVGACLFLPATRRTSVLLSDIRDYRVSILSCVPTLFFAMIRRPDFMEWDVSSVRAGFIGGSGCSKEQFEYIEKSFGMTLLSSLGQTESTGGITTSDLDDTLEIRATTVGHFMDKLEGKIADPNTGKTCPTGVIGEICVRGYVVMQGYYKNPEATSAAIDSEGWLHTGDSGWMGEDGYIRLAGRLKDLIIRGGENISPAEVEAAALEDDYIEICKAVGVPDRFYGEEICLCIILKEGFAGNTAGLREILIRKLASFKVPKYILVFENFPHNYTGKIDVAKLREEACRRLGL